MPFLAGILWGAGAFAGSVISTVVYEYYVDELEPQVETTNTAINAIQTLLLRV